MGILNYIRTTQGHKRDACAGYKRLTNVWVNIIEELFFVNC